jgi:hypothetical protein
MGAAANLQSGFVLAVLVGAILFADRLGGADEVARRLFQLVLGVAVAFVVVGGTSAFLRAPDYPDTSSSSSFNSGSSESQEQKDFFEDLANHNDAVTAIHFGVGAVLAVAGAALVRRRATIALSLILGGLLLVLFGGVTSGSDSSGDPLSAFAAVYSSLLGSVVGKGSLLADAARFAALAAGTAVLMLYALWRWDAPALPTEPASESPMPAV